MTQFKIQTVRQGHMVLVSGHSEVAQIRNDGRGWEATRTEGPRGPSMKWIGEPVRVSHLVNQPDGAEQIAVALGL
ncbi:hypothetical protein J2792_002355 [Novosphingobium capsulatum]|uniref:Uncharacterized protein n=1 Tax=Novosphingobium capsulatum TaxID=13688 RepID=A0ABU1MMV1_9SPHN|nr:hypothetical protein [Novosphingobium capsulatum]MDR6511483.1 hypothetical protein [Novosphingobium capsulatum]